MPSILLVGGSALVAYAIGVAHALHFRRAQANLCAKCQAEARWIERMRRELRQVRCDRRDTS